MNKRNTLLSGIALAGLGVMIGAFGAHALQPILAANNRLDTFETGVRYHFYHAFALLAIGMLMDRFNAPSLRYASLFILLGVVIFSGSLYVLSLTGITILGAVTPFGGALMITGWILLFVGVFRSNA